MLASHFLLLRAIMTHSNSKPTFELKQIEISLLQDQFLSAELLNTVVKLDSSEIGVWLDCLAMVCATVSLVKRYPEMYRNKSLET
jgi:hypothetical protein